MGANVSAMIDALIDAKVQNQVPDQRRILERLDKETHKSEKFRLMFADERGVKVCSDLIPSTDYVVATLATRILANLSETEETVKKINAELDISDVILQLKVYPEEFCLEAFRLLANLSISERSQQAMLEMGVFAPLHMWVSKENDKSHASQGTAVRLQALRCCQAITKCLTVSRILIQRNMLYTYIKLSNHTDAPTRGAAVAILANLCRSHDLKGVLIRHGVILQFALSYLESTDLDIRYHSMRGLRSFAEVFVDLGNLRYLTGEDIEFVSNQVKMKFPAVLGKPTMDITIKFLSRQSVAESFDRLERLAIAEAEAEEAVVWIHNLGNNTLWTWNKRSVHDKQKDLKPNEIFSIHDTYGLVGECFQSGRVETINNCSDSPKYDHMLEIAPEGERPSQMEMRNMIFVPLQDKLSGKFHGVLQVINKSTDHVAMEEDDVDEEDDDENFFTTEVAEDDKEELKVYGADIIKVVKVTATKIANVVPVLADKQDMLDRNQKILDAKAKKDTNRFGNTSFDIDVARLANTDIRTVLKTVMAVAQSVLKCDAGSFYVYDSNQELLWGVMQDGVRDFKMSSKTGIAGLVAREGKLLLIRDAYKHPLFNKSFDIKNGYRTKTMLLTPVRSMNTLDEKTGDPGGVVGVIQMINKYNGEFNKNDMQRLDELKGIVLPVIESKMKELEMELYERRTQTVEALEVLCNGVEYGNTIAIRTEAVYAVANIAANAINHDKLIKLKIIDVMIRAATPNLIGRSMETARNVVNRVDVTDPMYQNQAHVVMRVKTVEVLACLASNPDMVEIMVKKGVHLVFVGYMSSTMDPLRFQALRGLGNIAVCKDCHPRLLTHEIVDELNLHLASPLYDDIILVLRLINQLVAERNNVDLMYNLGFWDLLWDRLRDVDVTRKRVTDPNELDALTISFSAASYFCMHPDVRNMFLTEKPPRDILDFGWKQRTPKICAYIVRHFVYILEDTKVHGLFIETGGVAWLEKALKYVQDWRQENWANAQGIDPDVQRCWNYVAESMVELVKRHTSMMALIDMDVLTHVKVMLESKNEDMLYSVCRLFQIMGNDEGTRIQMVEAPMSMALSLAPVLSHSNTEIALECLIAMKVLSLPVDRNYMLNLETLCAQTGPELIRLLRYPSIDSPNEEVAIPACKILQAYCASGSCRTELIQTGIVPDLIYQSREVDENDPRSGISIEYRIEAEELMMVMDDAFQALQESTKGKSKDYDRDDDNDYY